ncbi:MAG: LON peptidase substrate-binding domain-containing protein [Pseudomonadota bacterium]|nr:LON peptidase substrate-binding domain-containing protein [Pseudomonadota bacterium]
MEQVPIFALGAVLFPRSLVPLRVFEPRYMDMVKDCLRHGTSFGVCLITEGREVGVAASVQPVGCLARIVEWDMPDLGILQIVAEGTERFRVRERRVSPGGLILAGIELLAPELPLPVPPQHENLVRLLRAIVENADERYFPRPLRYDDAVWVGCRLADVLPIPIGRKQQALALEDPLARLDLLQGCLGEQRGR